MSRSGYTDEDENNTLGLYRQAVKLASNGKRGQVFFKELIEALDAMPVKELIAMDVDVSGDAVAHGGAVCAFGAYGTHKGETLEALEDEVKSYHFLKSINVARCLRKETIYMNDEYFSMHFSRWDTSPVKKTEYGEFENTNAGRWQFIRAWAVSNLKVEK